MWSSFYRASVSRTIASGVITIPGSGRYTVEPESGLTDDLTGVTLSSENVDGVLIELRPGTAGRTITLKHQGNLHLINGNDVELPTIYSTIWLRHYGSGVWGQCIPALYVP
jgi:hypothetical protein